ncbi:Rieske (2Fe-2S) protein [Pseudokineococcus marinus]|uniref:Rieske (2Fe-2S) protein n=1 Tax=Pseudokineococcus marinus TaxID=351215 RepID=A0A849BQJ3_9ACTN|nr:Rieske (2Fe-2S) protein [Pseudokineococcus marinus]NNH22794.1 Rieske (2Fe-2S) protein [Pseudokineococcus marinus]
MTPPTALAERLTTAPEAWEALDRPSYRAEHVLGVALNALGRGRGPVVDALHGTWLGHPLHPALTDVPIGAWTAALALDALDAVGASRAPGLAAASRACTAVGLVGAAAAVASGLVDWQHTHEGARRVGVVHGLLSATATGLQLASWRARGRGRTARGRALGLAGWCVVTASAALGGALVHRHGVGSDHADRSLAPRTFTDALPVADLVDGRPARADVDGVRVVLLRQGDGPVRAFGEECPHLRGPLSEGWVTREGLVCPWHGSCFSLEDGAVVHGPATAPLPRFEARVRGGTVQVRRVPPVPGASPGSVTAAEQHREDEEDRRARH